MSNAERLRVLVLYDEGSTYTPTVLEHIRSLSRLPHEVVYGSGVRDTHATIPLEAFDVVIIHYSVRLSLPDFISPYYQRALPGFTGLKVLFIQDEYDTTETARRWIEKLGIGLVFTCVPPEYVEAVYPRARFPSTTFVQTLTGFVPAEYERALDAPSIASRPLMLAYRGRPLPPWYGALAREKVEIAQRMKALCAARGIPCDIEWTEEKRIYGADWFRFLASARATLATESGCNVFDFDGDIRRAVEADLARDPATPWEVLYERHVARHEGPIRMNQVSPRVFEAISVGTGLVLYEGEYSGVLQRDRHFIPLAKDFSNVDEVLAKVADVELMEAMVRRTHEEIILGGRYGYPAAMRAVAAAIAQKARKVRTRDLYWVCIGSMPEGGRPELAKHENTAEVRTLYADQPLLYAESRHTIVQELSPGHLMARGAWRALPVELRNQIRPLLPRVRAAVQKVRR